MSKYQESVRELNACNMSCSLVEKHDRQLRDPMTLTGYGVLQVVNKLQLTVRVLLWPSLYDMLGKTGCWITVSQSSYENVIEATGSAGSEHTQPSS